jgi:hypothetical protein
MLTRTLNDDTWEIFDDKSNFVENILSRSFLCVSHVIEKSNGFGITPFDWLEKQKKKSFPFSIPWVIVLSVHYISLGEPCMLLMLFYLPCVLSLIFQRMC